MRRFVFVLVAFMFLLTGCQSVKEYHDYAVRTVKEKYAPDVVEYDHPSGDTAFSTDHEFYMSSEDLGDVFKIYIRHWREVPEYLDTYLSVKYANYAEAQFLAGLVGHVGFLGDAYRVTSNFATVLNPMELSSDTTFFQWYDTLWDDVSVGVVILVDDYDTYDFATVSDLIIAYQQSLHYRVDIDVMWVNDDAYSLEDDTLEYSYLMTDGGYYARVVYGSDGYVEWSNTSKEIPFWSTDFYIETKARAELLQSANKAHAERVQVGEEVPATDGVDESVRQD